MGYTRRSRWRLSAFVNWYDEKSTKVRQRQYATIRQNSINKSIPYEEPFSAIRIQNFNSKIFEENENGIGFEGGMGGRTAKWDDAVVSCMRPSRPWPITSILG